MNRPLLELSGPVKSATLTVTGITCRYYCTQKIKAALLSTTGIKSVNVQFSAEDNLRLSYYTDHVDMERIKSIIESLGHGISSIKAE